jgi:hypothetical protein
MEAFMAGLAQLMAQANQNGNGHVIAPTAPVADAATIPSATKATQPIGQLLGAPVMTQPINTAPRSGVVHDALLSETPQMDNSSVKVPGRIDPATGQNGKPQTCYLKPETRGFIRKELGESAPILTLALLDEDGEPTNVRLALKLGQSSSGSLMYSAQGVEINLPLANGQAGATFKATGLYFVCQQFTRRLLDGERK